MKKNVKKLNRKQKPKWPIWIIGLGVLIFAIAIILLAGIGKDSTPLKVTGAPAIEVDNKIIDYGAVKLGTVINTSIFVTNVGDETLRISQNPYVELIEGC